MDNKREKEMKRDDDERRPKSRNSNKTELKNCAARLCDEGWRDQQMNQKLLEKYCPEKEVRHLTKRSSGKCGSTDTERVKTLSQNEGGGFLVFSFSIFYSFIVALHSKAFFPSSFVLKIKKWRRAEKETTVRKEKRIKKKKKQTSKFCDLLLYYHFSRTENAQIKNQDLAKLW